MCWLALNYFITILFISLQFAKHFKSYKVTKIIVPKWFTLQSTYFNMKLFYVDTIKERFLNAIKTQITATVHEPSGTVV